MAVSKVLSAEQIALFKRIAALEADVAAMEALCEESRAARSYTSAVTARSRLTTMREELYRLHDLADLVGITDPLDHIRKTIAIAEREGSWQAVARLKSTEADMLVKLAEARAQEEAAKLSALSSDDLVAMILDSCGALPRNVREEIAAALVA